MDFYALLQSHFSKLSVGKEHISKAVFFCHSLYDQPSSRQFSASASSFHRLLILPFSAETIEGRRENNGRFGWTSKEKGGKRGLGGRGVCIGHTYRPTHRQKEGGEEGKVIKVSDQAGFVCVCWILWIHAHTQNSTPWAVWVMPVPSQSTASLLMA